MTSGSTSFLVDTNILVYAFDPRDQDKQSRAVWILNDLIRTQRAVLSVQCLSEFFSVATRRLPEPLTDQQALAHVERFARSCRVLNLTSTVVLEGCRGRIQHGLSIWDALIWAVARLNQVPYLLTEDFEHGRFLEGVRYLNPLLPDFLLDPPSNSM